ncbi:hypothetical protein [Streptomyces sp. NPDC059076]|uniref:hypothetical protein n=1 Tax=unclassified Streptomyces TaxID=2593676 RepID=UPI0036AA5029
MVNQKYSPLADISYDPADEAVYSRLLTSRMALLRSRNLLGSALELSTSRWETVKNAERGRQNPLPPLVVVSSNRAGWIGAAIQKGLDELNSRGIEAFDNVSDLRALAGYNKDGPTPPLYAPSRAGANRGIYVVVHAAEYEHYQKQLGDTGITVVGWRFMPEPAQRNERMTGFGASRFAAMQFCKTLRSDTGGRWNSAWILDDNVVALTNFPGFKAVEDALGDHACAGFRGGTRAKSRDEVRTWAADEITENRGGQAAGPLQAAAVGLIQQAALWNVARFEANHLNFSPAFVASAEDVSIGNYFDAIGTDYQYYGGIGVTKEEVTFHDDSKGAKAVKICRTRMTVLMSRADNEDGKSEVMVLPEKNHPDDLEPLHDFVIKKVLPNASAGIQAQQGDQAVQYQAICQSVEQLTAGALKHLDCVSATARDAVFKINGAQEQAVTLRDAGEVAP